MKFTTIYLIFIICVNYGKLIHFECTKILIYQLFLGDLMVVPGLILNEKTDLFGVKNLKCRIIDGLIYCNPDKLQTEFLTLLENEFE